MKRLCLFIALVGTVTAAQAADAYRWVDANGVVHYSDVTPPVESKAELVHLRGAGSTTGAAVSTPNEPAKADDSKEPGDKKAPGTVASSVSAEKRCADARANLEVLQRNGPVAMDTGAANPQPLDDATRQRQIGSAQTIIATYCK